MRRRSEMLQCQGQERDSLGQANRLRMRCKRVGGLQQSLARRRLWYVSVKFLLWTIWSPTETTKDDKWESVANKKFSKRSKHHKQATEKVVCSCSCRTDCRTTGRSSPVHQFTWEWREHKKESNERSADNLSVLEKILAKVSLTYSGVGLPTVFRSSPLTWFCGERYIFSNSSGEIEMLPAVCMRFKASLGSMSPWRWLLFPLYPLLWYAVWERVSYASVTMLWTWRIAQINKGERLMPEQLLCRPEVCFNVPLLKSFSNVAPLTAPVVAW